MRHPYGVITSLRRRRLAAAKGEGERGAVAVEAALIFPVLILLVFGIIEFALLMRDHVATTSIVRAGARTASAAVDPAAGPTPSGVPQFVQTTVDAMERAGSALPKDSYESLWVYKAAANGYAIGATGPNYFEPADCSTSCIRYQWSDARDEFRPVDVNAWRESTIRACPGAPFDAVGVYLSAEHKWLTGVFGSTTKVSDRAVLNFEPFSLDECA